MSQLFEPLQVGELSLPNRVVMAPLTRCRASAGRVPNALMADYYAQRASAGLILTEATSVTPMGVGYPDTPGIWSEEQVEGWKKITRAVHAAGGRIVMQLWHVGRISDPELLGGAAAGRAERDRRRRPCPSAASDAPLCKAARARSFRDSRDHSGLSQGRREREAGPASTESNCTARTATCSTSSCRMARINAPTSGADPSRTALACCWPRPMRRSRSGGPAGSACTLHRAVTATR